MIELELTGWTATQREGLAFLLDDAQIPAEWGPDSVSVPDGSQAQAQRFVDFLADTSGDVRFDHADPPARTEAEWILDAPSPSLRRRPRDQWGSDPGSPARRGSHRRRPALRRGRAPHRAEWQHRRLDPGRARCLLPDRHGRAARPHARQHGHAHPGRAGGRPRLPGAAGRLHPLARPASRMAARTRAVLAWSAQLSSGRWSSTSRCSSARATGACTTARPASSSSTTASPPSSSSSPSASPTSRRRTDSGLREFDRGGFPLAQLPGNGDEHDRCVHPDRPRTVRDPRAVEPEPLPSPLSMTPRPRRSSNATTRPVITRAQWTILAIGSSMMSVAPASFRAGIRMLISDFATTVSTA